MRPHGFSFNGNLVGHFKEQEFPQREGLYHYMPARGFGHYEMLQTLENTGVARCCLVETDKTIYFSVVACPEYGILLLISTFLN